MRNLRVRAIYFALALLTLFAVFAATAGAREALATRTQAVRQTIAANPPMSRTITVASTWNDVQGALASTVVNGLPPTVDSNTIDSISAELRMDFDQGPVTLSPPSADLSLMTTGLSLVPADLPGTGQTPVKIEITERQPFPEQMRLVSGRYPVATRAIARDQRRPARPSGKQKAAAPKAITLQVAMRRRPPPGSAFTPARSSC